MLGVEALGELQQHRVAGGVAEAVVDRLEVVEVHEDHGQPGALAPCARERVAHALHEQRAVGEVRDGVVEGLVRELLLERLALAHVAAVEHDAVDVLVVEEVGVEHLELADAAIDVAHAALEHLGAGGRVRRGIGEHVREPALLPRLQQPDEAGAHDLLGGVAEDALDRGALVDDRPGRVEHGDEVARVPDQRAEARLARAPVHLLGQRRALERERDLGRQRGEAALQGLRDPLLARDRQQPVRFAAYRERQRERVRRSRRQPELVTRERGNSGLSAGCEQRVDGRGLDRPRRGELGVGGDKATVLGQAEPGGRAVAGELAGRGEGRVADVLAARGGDQIGARGAEDPLARDGALLLTDEAGHARHDEAEEEDRGHVDHETVVRVVDDLQQRHHRSHERGADEQHQALRGEARGAVRRGALELGHRWVQRRRAPQQVEADPADVEPHLAVVGAREGDEAVGEVGREQGDDAQGQEVERGPARARVDSEPDGGRQQQDVADRVGDRDQLRDGREPVVVQRGLDQCDPRDQRKPQCDDQGVDQPGAVALRVAPADQDQEARHERRVDDQVRRVPDRRERHLVVEQPRVAVRVEVARPEEEEPEREPAPRAGGDRAVAPEAHEDRDHRREPEQVEDRAASRERRHEDVQRGDDRPDDQVGLPQRHRGEASANRHLNSRQP